MEMTKHSSRDYDIDIEIDADTGDVIWTHRGTRYFYSVEELEGKGQILGLLPVTDTQITVYSQTETMTKDEYIEYMGI
jgi:hypothetical protein